MTNRPATNPESDEAGAARAGEVVVEASQLRPGVHVRLPVGWLDHPFVLNSFVIADAQQVRQIAELRLPQLFSDPARCTVAPLPRAATPPPLTPEQERERAELADRTARQLAEKQARAQAIGELRTRLDAAQAHYLLAAKAVGAAIQRFEASPRESVVAITEVSARSTQVLMKDADSALALIAEKGHSDITYAHALSVMTLALLLGKHARLSEDALREIGIGALLHDIGKAALSSSVLRKTERSRHEEAIYQSHCRLGHEAAVKAGSLSRPVLDAVLRHHERSDGSGFPGRLAGHDIPLAARVIGIANRFDNLTNPLDPRRAMTPSEALAWMWSKERTGFDEVLLQLFVRAMGVYPPGSLVQLSDGRTGVVVASAAADSPLRPQVLVHQPGVPRRHALIVDLATETALKIDKPIGVQGRDPDELDYLLPRRKMSWFHMKADH